jgi:single-stranded-DNA-specific exonuclease
MRFLYDLVDTDSLIDAFLSLRGIDEFDGKIILSHGEQEGDWVDSEVVESAKSKLANRDTFVHADYDTDGVSSAGVAGVYDGRFSVIIPERAWGYGLTEKSMAAIRNDSALITADCGVSNVDEIAALQERNVSVIVTDHHEPPLRMPNTMIVHPKLLNRRGFCGYSGAGVLYKFLRALYGKDNEDAVQFAAIGTITDMMPVVDENRIIIRRGINEIRSNPNYRISYLLGALKKKHKYIDAKDISFYLGPTINSCSRMGRVDVLREWILGSENDARLASVEMVKINEQRKKAVASAIEMADCLFDDRISVYVLPAKDFGVSGVVANSLSSSLSKPVVVCTQHGDTISCSVRSHGKVDAHKMTDWLKQRIEISGGGHVGAAGFKYKIDCAQKSVYDIVNAIADFVSIEGVASSDNDYVVDFWTTPEAIPKIKKELSRLLPFGVGLEQPTFGFVVYPDRCKIMGDDGNHIKIETGELSVLFFNQGKHETHKLAGCSAIRVAVEIDFSTSFFNNGTSVIARHWEYL